MVPISAELQYSYLSSALGQWVRIFPHSGTQKKKKKKKFGQLRLLQYLRLKNKGFTVGKGKDIRFIDTTLKFHKGRRGQHGRNRHGAITVT